MTKTFDALLKKYVSKWFIKLKFFPQTDVKYYYKWGLICVL